MGAGRGSQSGAVNFRTCVRIRHVKVSVRVRLPAFRLGVLAEACGVVQRRCQGRGCEDAHDQVCDEIQVHRVAEYWALQMTRIKVNICYSDSLKRVQSIHLVRLYEEKL